MTTLSFAEYLQVFGITTGGPDEAVRLPRIDKERRTIFQPAFLYSYYIAFLKLASYCLEANEHEYATLYNSIAEFIYNSKVPNLGGNVNGK